MANWDKRYGEILTDLLARFDIAGIRYFIFRNYELLPDGNSSKDVDIAVDPKRIADANDTIREVFCRHGLSYIYKVRFHNAHCWRGIEIGRQISIQIDLIAGYVNRGYEIFSFDELYSHTVGYKEFRVLDKLYEGLMLLIYKQFGYKRPVLKPVYEEIIYDIYRSFPEFSAILQRLVGEELAGRITEAIARKDFSEMLSYAPQLSDALQKYAWRKSPLSVIGHYTSFLWHKAVRLVFRRRRYIKSFAVIAPDGAGKTSFLEALIDNLRTFFKDEPATYNLYHFRPGILPNLGSVGEKMGVMTQNTDFTTPHRAKPANPLSSLLRISYYWLDYVLGWYILVTRDVRFERFSIFDRYSYDMLVDPRRTRLRLPYFVRRFFVWFMPRPKVVFYLDADPTEIFRRKQELTPEEIIRQVAEYRKLAKADKRIVTLDGNRPTQESADEALKIILDTFCIRIND